ncbi:enoyl-CoA hydratase/isomerase family protein [Xanthobacter autotrophicus DSM 597]|uniref:enoyl-CoA hydratase/isomerase family protein n=1 Tax=Xanthobacter wiegelii TaxID=3119913 RepID=UPI00372BF5EC
MADATLTWSLDDAVCRIVLSRPEKGNALSGAAVRDLDRAFDAALTQGARLVVFEGAGRHFCTGFDLSDLDSESDGDLLLRFVTIEGFLRKVFDAPVVTVALGRGSVFGAGADLFAACDHRIAVETPRFAFPGSGFGLVLGTARLASRVGRDRARSILLRGEVIDSARALAIGLVTEQIAEEDIDAALADLVREAKRLDPQTVAALRGATKVGDADAELADLCRSAARDGLKARIVAYRAHVLASARQKTA